MQRAVKIYDQIDELCSAHNTTQFDLSFSSKNEGWITIKENKIDFKDLNLSLNDIRHLIDSRRIIKIRDYHFKELENNEQFRYTYSLYIELDNEKYYPEPKFLRVGYLIALTGGVFILGLGIYMTIYKINLLGYDTQFGGGYSYNRLSPGGAIILGAFLIMMALSGILGKNNKE